MLKGGDEMRSVKDMWHEVKPDLISIEMLKYSLFGTGTAIIDVVVYSLCYKYLPIRYAWLTTASNIIAWIAATLFAFYTNKLFVFHARNNGKKHFLYEFLAFFGARALTLVLSLVLLILLVDVLHANPYYSKIGTNVLVIILNYIFSKLIIFRKK